MDSVPPRPRPASLGGAAVRFTHAIDSANACLRPVNGAMAGLQACWRGEGSVRFGQAMSDWEREFELILDRLGDLRELVTTSGVRSDERSRGR